MIGAYGRPRCPQYHIVHDWRLWAPKVSIAVPGQQERPDTNTHQSMLGKNHWHHDNGGYHGNRTTKLCAETRPACGYKTKCCRMQEFHGELLLRMLLVETRPACDYKTKRCCMWEGCKFHRQLFEITLVQWHANTRQYDMACENSTGSCFRCYLQNQGPHVVTRPNVVVCENLCKFHRQTSSGDVLLKLWNTACL